jgi:hypothetical protein
MKRLVAVYSSSRIPYCSGYGLFESSIGWAKWQAQFQVWTIQMMTLITQYPFETLKKVKEYTSYELTSLY